MAGVASFLRNDSDHEQTGEEKIIYMIKLAKLSHQRKDYKKSEQFLHLALRTAYDIQHHQARKYIIDEMANNAFESGNLHKAEHLFKEMIKLLLADGMQPDELPIIHISAKLASLYAHFHDDVKASQGFKFCAHHLETKINQQLVEDFDTLAVYSLVLSWFGEFVYARGKLTESIALFKKSHDINVRINGPQHPHFLLQLNYLANSYSALSRHDEAIECLSSAILLTSKKQSEEQDQDPLPYLYINLANVYLTKLTNAFIEAEKCMNKIKKYHDFVKNRKTISVKNIYLVSIETKTILLMSSF
uniref:EOG090X06TI n=1 Tax=Eubosmina coregoni TaxID=186181 RepID=A0A4Y7LLQ5_9CRUS|nr:EOG090X06TI [Eubosmina coregoni]SVE69820.1 EOG090X06TI [Eubosmina coregoni]